MKRLLMIGLCLWSALWVYGQRSMDMFYSYDHNGNRIMSEIRFVKTGSDTNVPKELGPMPFVQDTIGTVEVNVYPNPTSDKVLVATKGVENGQRIRAVLMSANGDVLDEKTVINTQETFDVSGQASGIYLLELYANREKHVWKIIKN